MPLGVVLLSLLNSLDELMAVGVAVTAVSLSKSALGDLTLLQWRALRVAEHGARVSDMAEALSVSLPSMSKMVKRLHGRGLVDIHRGEGGDERVRMVTVTDEGRRALRLVIGLRRQYLQSALSLAGLSSDARFASQLSRLAEVLSGVK